MWYEFNSRARAPTQPLSERYILVYGTGTECLNLYTIPSDIDIIPSEMAGHETAFSRARASTPSYAPSVPLWYESISRVRVST